MATNLATALDTPEQRRHPIGLRELATLHYQTHSVTIAEMAEQEPFCQVSKRTLEHWASEMRWTELRRQYQEDVSARILHLMADDLVNQRIEQLSRLENLESKMRDILVSGDLVFKSLEGGVNAYVRLAQFYDQLLEKILGSIPSHQASPTRPLRTSSLTVEEKRLAVKVVLESRRKKAREKMDSSEPVPA